MSWGKHSIEDICIKITSGGTPLRSRTEFYDGGTIPWIKTKEVNFNRIYDSDECITVKGLENSSAKLVPENSILIAMYGDGKTAGRCAISRIPVTTNQACCNLVIDQDKANPDFVFYKISTLYETLRGLKVGGSQQNLNAKTLREFEIEIPPLPTQRKIASILSAYDDLIENNLKRIKLLEEKAALVYKNEFGSYQVSNKDFDSLPKGWSVKTIGEVFGKLESGSRPKGGIDKELKEGIASVGAENVIGLGKYNYSSEKFITEPFYKNMNRGKIEDRDILIYKDGAYIGKTTLFQDGFPHEDCCVNEHVFLLRAENDCYQYFLFFTLNQNLYFEKMQQLNANAAQPGINQESLKSLKLIWPSVTKVEAFDNEVKDCIMLIFVLAKQNTKLREARDILLPRLMSGQNLNHRNHKKPMNHSYDYRD